jgi:acetyl-CoA C-acetyltransferase
MKDVYIVEAKRTPIGSFLGSFSEFSATQLGAIAIKEILQATKLGSDAMDSASAIMIENYNH